MTTIYRDCVKIEFVTSTSGRSLIIRTDFSVESAAADFEMTFKEFSHSLFRSWNKYQLAKYLTIKLICKYTETKANKIPAKTCDKVWHFNFILDHPTKITIGNKTNPIHPKAKVTAANGPATPIACALIFQNLFIIIVIKVLEI